MTISRTKQQLDKQQNFSPRKWFGVVWLFIEVNLFGGTIFGFPALFKVLPEYRIYANDEYCSSSLFINRNETTRAELSCETYQTRQYQNALTLGIILFEIPALVIGPLIDRFGCRFVKLIGILLHVIGWLALALLKPGRDSLLYVHTSCSSLAGIIVLLTAYTSSDYFSKHRAIVSALFAGACTSATMWYSIFQVLIDAKRISLQNLSYIWMSLGLILFISAFIFLDWKFPLLNLPYHFDTKLEQKNETMVDNSHDCLQNIDQGQRLQTKWYRLVIERQGVWLHLTDPLYILVVLFLSILLLPGIFLAVTWYPWVYFITNQNTELANRLTFAFNLLPIAGIIICPINGFLLGFRANQSKKQKLFNIALMQTVSWLINIVACLVCMFPDQRMIIPALIINFVARSTIVGGSQAVIATFFPSEFSGTLTGVMWTAVGAISTIQYGLVLLTDDVSRSWRAWLLILCCVLLMFCHLVQVWWKYLLEARKHKATINQERNVDSL